MFAFIPLLFICLELEVGKIFIITSSVIAVVTGCRIVYDEVD